MRTYLILKEQARSFNEDGEIQAALAAYQVADARLEALRREFCPEKAAILKAHTFNRAALGARGLGLEHLDQLTVELLGVR